MLKKLSMALAALAAAIVCLCGSLYLLVPIVMREGATTSTVQPESIDVAMGERFQTKLNNNFSSALEGVLEIKKVYWLSDHDPVAPKPRAEFYGLTKDSAVITQLLQDAQPLLEGQQTLLTPDTKLAPGTQVKYYLDDTIFSATWKQAFRDTMYTISEIKIAHPSQFRRFFSGGTFGSSIQQTTTEMARNVNAVVAATGDFYSFRDYGIIINGGTVYRADPQYTDTCYVDENGDLLFTYRGELNGMDQVRKFVEEKGIRFSMSFGPVLIDDGEMKDYPGYLVGGVYDPYSRAAICQLGPLHYLLVVCTQEGDYTGRPTMKEFQNVIATFEPQKAYALDGGQSAVIAIGGKAYNQVNFGYERDLSDIVYFATAIPNWE